MVVGPPSLLLCFSRSRSSPPRLNRLVTLRPSMVTSSTSSPSEKEIECDLRPASVLIFQRQGDWGAGGQLDKMKKVVNRVARGKGGVDDEEGDGSGEDDGKPLNGDDGEGEAGKLAQDETHPKL